MVSSEALHTRPQHPGTAHAARLATPADAEGIVRLRSAHVLAEPLPEEWIVRSGAELAARLAPAGDARACVVDAADGALVSCALALLHPALPEPASPGGRAARMHTVATHPAWRRRGHARSALTALLDRLRAEGVAPVEADAPAGVGALFRASGFCGSVAPMRMTWPEPAVRGRVDERTGHVWLPPEQYAETVMKATGFACVLFTDVHDRPVQLHGVYSATHPWQLVGGTMDPGERPWETAVRECREETGIELDSPPRLLATVYGLPGAEWPYSTMGLVFDGGRLDEARLRDIVLDPREHDEMRVLALPEWRPLMPPRDFARLSAVMEARRTGVAAYFDTWDWGTE
ncbi:GNAT family N-acetyltransferase [Streptomyces griseoluteus]|uniref:GNAT family N-acetyltransferase n=1 Tax=Streptomyces griseoluteus TaxID=29306 RepID=A0A4Z1DNR6_STRGP|nr:GNAT family N-acetyltransferase [Streptomyces griseoluteus]